MPPKRLAQRDLEVEQKKGSGFFSLFKKKKAPVTNPDSINNSSVELRKKLGLDSSNSLSIEKLHEQLQQEADSFSDTMAKQYEEEQKSHEESSASSSSISVAPSNQSMVPDDLLSSSPSKPSPIPETKDESSPLEPEPLSDVSDDVPPSPVSLDSVSTSVVDDNQPIHEEENLDLQKEIEAVPESSGESSLVPDFLLSEQDSESNSSVNNSTKKENSKDKTKNGSKTVNSWTDDDDTDDSLEGGEFAKEPEPVISEPSNVDDSNFPQPVSLDADSKSEEKKSSKKESKKAAKKVSKAVKKEEKVSKKAAKKSSKETKEKSKTVKEEIVVKENEDEKKSDLKTPVPLDSKVPDDLISDQDTGDANSQSDSSWLEEPSENLTPSSSSSFLDEPEVVLPEPVPVPENLSFNSPNEDVSLNKEINLDIDKAEAFARELSSSTESVAKEHSIDAPASPFDLNPAPNLSKQPVIDDLDEPRLTSFEEPKRSKKGFLSKLFGSKPSADKDIPSAPLPDPVAPNIHFENNLSSPPNSLNLETSVEMKTSSNSVLPVSSDSNDALPLKTDFDASTPIEANDPYQETPEILRKRASTLNSIIESGKLDVLFVDKNGAIASNEDELVESKLNSDEHAFDQDADKIKKHHHYISSFAHDIDIIINAAKEAASSGDLLLAKKKYNEAKDLYAASELEDHTRELLYVTLKDLFDDIHLKLLEAQAKDLIGE